MSKTIRDWLGGSDIAAVIGVDPYRTAVDLYLSKISDGPAENISDAKRAFFNRRKAQEPVIASLLRENFGVSPIRLSISDTPNRYSHPDHAFLRAEIDFEFEMDPLVRDRFSDHPGFAAIPDGTLLNGEIKTVHPFAAKQWGEETLEEIPTHYAAQVMFGLEVTNRPACLVVALVGLDTLLGYPVVRDLETCAMLRDRGVDFWTRNVLQRIPPAVQNHDDINKLFARKLGAPITLTPDELELLRHVKRHRYDSKRATEGAELAAFKLTESISARIDWINGKPEDAILFDGEGEKLATWKGQQQSRINLEKLRERYPSVALDCATTIAFRSLRFLGEPK
jgi:putative phage-type endonuclease